MKIATFNANSIRSRLNIIIDWLNENSPEVLCVQETKVQDKDFPVAELARAGYNVVFCGQKSYNGVAILSKLPIENFRVGFDTAPAEGSRLISAEIAGVPIVNTYIPQGRDIESPMYRYKLEWLRRLGDYFRKHYKPDEPLLWLGDCNIAIEDRDVHSPERLAGSVCFNPELSQYFKEVTDFGFTDLFRTHCDLGGEYTFWDYRVPNGFKRNLGWRIDYIMATSPLVKKCTNCCIDKAPRALEKPSDHTFLIAEFKNR